MQGSYIMLHYVSKILFLPYTENTRTRGWADLQDSTPIERYGIGKVSSGSMRTVLGAPFDQGQIALRQPEAGVHPIM